MHKLILMTIAVASILATAGIANAIDFGPIKAKICVDTPLGRVCS